MLKTFLDLPPEIRNAIYEHAAKAARIEVDGDRLRGDPEHPEKITTAIPFVSHQTRVESLPIIYSMAPISTTVWNWGFDHLYEFEERLSAKNLQALQSNPSRVCTVDRHNRWSHQMHEKLKV